MKVSCTLSSQRMCTTRSSINSHLQCELIGVHIAHIHWLKIVEETYARLGTYKRPDMRLLLSPNNSTSRRFPAKPLYKRSYIYSITIILPLSISEILTTRFDRRVRTFNDEISARHVSDPYLTRQNPYPCLRVRV